MFVGLLFIMKDMDREEGDFIEWNAPAELLLWHCNSNTRNKKKREII